MAEVVRTVHASPQAVSAVLADGWLYPVWVVGASRMRAVDADWPAPGSCLHHSFGVWPAVLDDRTEVLEWEPRARMVVEAHGWPLGKARVDMTLREVPEGCVVRIVENASGGPGLLIPKPVLDVAIGFRNTETLRRLAFLAEGGARGDSDVG